MKTLTVKQPWAALIVHGIKDIENRTWATKFRGRILIHSSASPVKPPKGAPTRYPYTPDQWAEICRGNKFDKAFLNYPGAPNGMIVGSVEVVDCVINHPSIWAEHADLPFRTDEQIRNGEPEDLPKPIYNWVLSNPVLFNKPIADVKGKLSLWEFPCTIEGQSGIETL